MNNLREEKTFWIFLLSSRKQQPESNNIRDVGFGLYCLENAHIDKNDIFLLIDCEPMDQVQSILKEFTNQSYDICPSSKLVEIIRKNEEYTHMVLFVLGHGSECGIASRPIDITPHMLYSSIRQSSTLVTATVYLGQCFAGLFNYMDAQSVFKEDGKKSPNIIVLGATGLYSSIASSTTEKIKDCKIRWAANIFLYYVFLWFKNPLDKDGDSHFTIMDSFKYAALMTNFRNNGIRVENFIDKLRQIQKISRRIKFWEKQFLRVLDTLKLLEDNTKKIFSKPVARSNKHARQTKVRSIRRNKSQKDFFYKSLAQAKYNLNLYKRNREDILEIFLFNSQEAWVLHSLVAQQVEFPPISVQ